MKRRLSFLIVLAALFIFSYNALFFTFREVSNATWREVLIKDGTVIDGTGRKPYRADVLIKGAKIAAVGHGIIPSPGSHIVNAQGKIILPGFVEVRSGAYPSLREQRRLVFAGVTSIIGEPDKNAYDNLERYFYRFFRNKPLLNFGVLIDLGDIKNYVEQKTPGVVSTAFLHDLVKEGLSDGAIGVLLDFNRLPGAILTWEEIKDILKNTNSKPPLFVVELSNDIYYQDSLLIQKLKEIFEYAQKTPFRPYLRHFRLPKGVSRETVVQIQNLLSRQKKTGLNLVGDINPFYLDGSPRYLLDEAVERFYPEEIVIAKAPLSLKELEGKSLSTVIREQGIGKEKLVRKLKGTGILVELCDTGGEKNGALKPFFGWQAVYSPRGENGWSEEPRPYLELLKNDDSAPGVPLEEKIYRLIGLPARYLGLKGRGRIEQNYYADILIVENKKGEYILDYCFVNGKPVVRNGRLTGIKPGRILREGK